MHFSLLCQIGLAALAASAPPASKGQSKPGNQTTKPPVFFLAGDSTTAPGGGWGNGFLGTLIDGAAGKNFGHNGTTTNSFVVGGDWANVIAAVQTHKSMFTPYVTIQFGHNDQKPENHVSIEKYTANLKSLAQQVIAAGATPIMITSISRRKYVGGVIKPDLAIQVKAALGVAAALRLNFIDLNAASMKYLNAAGEAKARTFDLAQDDYTHMNPGAGKIFGNMVAGLISESSVGSAVKSYIKEDANIKAMIAAGK